MQIEDFDYNAVELLSSMFKERFDINRNYLLSLNVDSLLFPFRNEAALGHWTYSLAHPDSVPKSVLENLPPSKAQARARKLLGKPYDGWEHPTSPVRGAFLGHYLSACARIYATSRDNEMRSRAKYIVEELAKCQEQNGDGYVGPIPEKFFDILEEEKIGEIGAPYYIIHKVLMGLYDAYKLTGNPEAFLVMRGMVDYVERRIENTTDERMQRILNCEFGGMSEVLYDFYGETGEPRHLSLAQKFEHHRILEPLAKNQDNLTGVHANATIPKIHGAARAYELTHDSKYRNIAVNFWEIIGNTRTYATGGSTGTTSRQAEHWGEPNKLKPTLSETTQETCVTYNWLRLCRYLLRWTANAKYGDMYERALFNGILPIQNPKNGMLAYHTPLATGSKKMFGSPTASFWCCYGTGVQAFADFASSIYFHNDDTLLVNLFIPSELQWSQAGKAIKIRQENKYPERPSTRLTIKISDSPAPFNLRIRVPWWIRKGFEIKVNNEEVQGNFIPSTFHGLDRLWNDGDIIDISMPMNLYAESINDDPDLVAIMYGPLVMAGLTSQPVEFHGSKEAVDSWMEHIAKESTAFYTKGQKHEIKFIPLYEVTSESYGVYFRVTS